MVDDQQLPLPEKDPTEDPWEKMLGSGKDLWADEKPDDYVRRLRQGWE